MRKIPPLSSVRVFESAARHQNFTRAAEELGMTQSAVSYQMKVLEERIRTKLFVRHKGRLSLTEAGRRIAPLVSDSFEALERAFSLALAEDDKILTISTTHTFAARWLAPRIGSFQVAHPQLAVRVRSDNNYVDLVADDVDVAIRGGLGHWDGLRAHFLMRVLIQPFASPDFLARHDPIKTPMDVMRLPRLSPDDSWWNFWLTQAGGEPHDESSTPGIRLDSQAMDGTAAIAGHGAAILDGMMWRDDVASGRLIPFSMSAVTNASYWLVYPEHRRESVKIRAFRRWLESEIAIAAGAQCGFLLVPPTE